MFGKQEPIHGYPIIGTPEIGERIETSKPEQQKGVILETRIQRLMTDGRFFVEEIEDDTLPIFVIKGETKKATRMALRKDGEAWKIIRQTN